jgi:hypothetical protein
MSDKKTAEDRQRAGTTDDIMGITHGGGRDQYGGTFGGGQSGGGAYANPHTGGGGGQGGNRVSGDRGDAQNTGGQTNQGYYGSGQMGDRNLDDNSHNAASTASGPEQGTATYRDHPSQHGEDVGDELSARAGSDEHQAFGKEHDGQGAQGQQIGKSG